MSSNPDTTAQVPAVKWWFRDQRAWLRYRILLASGLSPVKNEPFDQVSATASAAVEEARMEFVRRSRAARRHRVEVFGPSIARELPWDILLVLYSNYDRIKLNVSSVYADVSAPQTTVLRWLSHLEKMGFIERWPSSTDLRVSYIALSPAGKCTLDLYFDAILAVNNAAT